ncbi:hypothetical protein E4582_12455 [Luteimonas yindakuii]|uniref:Sugar transporter n=1 Tax=Luteimonas yindakuii TaxID=2565782 RepID=A0A4Z1RHB2_9GAMM|nr:lipoprotein [Luteimonas yindakuii]TKS53011.1 hypothetical protein E4582_12455 [Luteimonas yindakuii]
MNRSLLPLSAACLVALCLALSACGNKGDLFLPPPEPAVVDDAATPAEPPADDADDLPPVDGDGDTPPVDGSGTVPVPTGAAEGDTTPPTGDGDGAA